MPVIELGRLAGQASASLVRRLRRNHLRAQLGVRREHAVEANQVQPWSRHQGRKPLHEVTPAPEPAPVVRRAPEPEPEVAPPAPAPAVEVEDEVEETGPKEPVAKARPKPAAESKADRLRRLDAEAEALWQAGDLAGAEARYREIVQLAPGARAADLAYGDLFSLARQRHGADEEAALWRAYLEVFPRGRYADDARAGLCRRAAGEERRACWQAYLADFPAGVHRNQAARVLGEAETGG